MDNVIFHGMNQPLNNDNKYRDIYFLLRLLRSCLCTVLWHDINMHRGHTVPSSSHCVPEVWSLWLRKTVLQMAIVVLSHAV